MAGDGELTRLRGARPEMRCTAIAKATGERCRMISVKGKERCCRHGGGGKLLEANKIALKQWDAMRPMLKGTTFEDEAVGLVPVGGRVALAEAWLAAKQSGDQVVYRKTRRAVLTRYQSRIIALGRADVLREAGIEV